MATHSDPTVRLLAVGDVFLGDLPTSYGFGVGSMMLRYGADFPFDHVRDVLRQGDIVVGNLESVISAHDRRKDDFERIVMRAQPEAAAALKRAGFHVLSFATNHTMQHGKAVVAETIQLLSEQGIAVCGVELPEQQVIPEAVVERGGLRVGFLGFNLRPQQYFLDPPLWPEPTPEFMRGSIARLRCDVDVLIVAMHWGDEFMDYPSPEQVTLGHGLIDSGADLILGHHPHILQGIERYKKGLIAYSLGNFVFDMWQRKYRRSMILDCRLSRQGVEGFEIIPIRINGLYQPVSVAGRDAEDMRSSISELSNRIFEAGQGLKAYQAEVARRTRKDRREVYWHYLRNVHRYSPRRLWQNFVGAVRRRS